MVRLRHSTACRRGHGEVIGPVIGLRERCRGVPRWRTKRAVRAAAMLDQVVDAQLPLVASLGEQSRCRAAHHLAELVMLAHSYRMYAEGRISRRELERRGRSAVTKLNAARYARPAARA